MAYSQRIATLKNAEDIWRPILRDGLPIAWETDAPDTLSYKLREIFHLAVIHASQSPDYAELARLKGSVQVKVKGRVVAVLPREQKQVKRFELGSLGEVLQVSGSNPDRTHVPASVGSSADDDGFSAAARAEDINWKQATEHIIGEWIGFRVKPQNRAWKNFYGGIDELRTLRDFARRNTLIMMYTREHGGVLTFAQWERGLEEFEWSEEEELAAIERARVEQIKESPFAALRRMNPDFEDFNDGQAQDDVRSGSGIRLDDAEAAGGLRESAGPSGRSSTSDPASNQPARDGRAVPSIDDILGG